MTEEGHHQERERCDGLQAIGTRQVPHKDIHNSAFLTSALQFHDDSAIGVQRDYP